MEPNRTDLTKEEILFSCLELGRDTYLSNQESRVLQAMESYSQQSTKHLQDRVKELESLLEDIRRYDYDHLLYKRVSAISADLSSRIISALNTKS